MNEKFLSTAIYSKWIVKYFREEHHIAIYYLCFIFRYTHKNEKKERNYNINVKELSFRDSAALEKRECRWKKCVAHIEKIAVIFNGMECNNIIRIFLSSSFFFKCSKQFECKNFVKPFLWNFLKGNKLTLMLHLFTFFFLKKRQN